MDILSPHFLVAPLNTIEQMAADPHVNARKMFVDLPTWNGGSLRVVNSPVKLSRTPVEVTRGFDRPGGHTRTILKDALGLEDARIDALFETGVVA
jgi:crotonobetainyl-CoA:carnitine CoA-transferase CaiB-like acyl-CoA transferase